MGINTIRKMTEEDLLRLQAAAARFCRNHAAELEEVVYNSTIRSPERQAGIASLTGNDALEAISHIFGNTGGCPCTRAYLRPLWLRAFRRAVKHPTADTYGYGYIGWEAK